MSQAELQSHLVPLMARKVPLPDIIKAISGVSEDQVIAAFDDLMFEALDVERSASVA